MVLTTSIITLTLTACYVGLILFLIRGWKKLKDFHVDGKIPKTRVSIIIAARNEEENIAFTIEDILRQTYSKHLYELIVIDDHSTDRTAEIISSYANQGVKLIKLNESEKLNSYKKKAIAEAIQISSGELIVTTDADCRMGSQWLATVVGCFEQHQYQLISSPVAYFQEKNTFEKMQTLEFSFLIGLGASGIGNKIPSTCNGANLAYRKDVFFEVDGFKGIDDLASGDDELLLHKIAARYPGQIGFCKSKDAVVYTQAKENLSEFIKQRKRWASKSTKYKDKRMVVIAVCVWLFNLSFLLNLITGFFVLDILKLFCAQYIIKIFMELYFLRGVTSFNNRRDLLKYIPVLTFIHSIYIVFIGVAGNTGKYDWKGRMVK